MSIKREIDPVPEEFESYENAADFWDEHDSVDYEDILEAVEVQINLSERHYLIELDTKTARVLQNRAQERGVDPNQLASELLRKTLVGGK